MNSVAIPRGSWRGNRDLPLTFPRNWKVMVTGMADAPDVPRAEIRKAFASPIGREPIRKLAEGTKTAAISPDGSLQFTPPS